MADTSRNPYREAGYRALKFEPHLHTVHSDGADTVTAMFEACASAGYDAVALTDHNTASGLAEAERAAAANGLIMVPGVEVTTFRGHAVTLGVTRAPEWRDLDARGLDALAADVHAEGGVLSIAHPAALGSPVCSGCTWGWPIEPTAVDTWEVLAEYESEVEASLELWRRALARGSTAAPVGVGDVHNTAAASAPRPATYVYTRARTAADVLDALRRRRLFASRGRTFDFWLEHPDGRVALVGERVAGGGWSQRASAPAEFAEVEAGPRSRCVSAEVRGTHGGLEAISAPIWIDSSH